jgi:hypothetical protein
MLAIGRQRTSVQRPALHCRLQSRILRVSRRWSTQAEDGGAATTPRRKTRCIGILGGMSPSSTELYYTKLNNSVREMLGGLHSANCIIRSVDFEEIAALQSAGRWDDAGALLGAAAADLESGGAELLILVREQPHGICALVSSCVVVHIRTTCQRRLPGCVCLTRPRTRCIKSHRRSKTPLPSLSLIFLAQLLRQLSMLVAVVHCLWPLRTPWSRCVALCFRAYNRLLERHTWWDVVGTGFLPRPAA